MSNSNDAIEADNHRIYNSTNGCERLFQQLRSKLAQGNTMLYATVRDHHIRYERWIDFVGALANERASLDSRLLLHPEIRALVLQMLQMLETNLHHALRYEGGTQSSKRGVTTSSDNPENGSQHQKNDLAVPQLRHKHDATDQSAQLASRAALDAVHGTIERLHRMAIVIRRSSTSNLASKMKTFAQKTDAAENARFQRVMLFTLNDLYRDISDSLADQLLASVSYRRLRLLYQRRHQKKLGTRRRDQPREMPPVEPNRNPVISNPIQQPPPEPDKGEEISQAPSVPRTEVGSSTNHSGFDHSEYQKHRLENTEPQADEITVTSVTQDYSYPKPPKLEDGANTCACEWCFEEILASQLNEGGWWKSHFQKDLEPYVCISEDCFEPAVYFTSFSQWRRHMDEAHTIEWPRIIHSNKVWYCDLEPDEYQEFSSADELRVHLSTQHSESFTERQITRWLNRNVMSSPREPNVCPLCNQNVLDVIAMQERLFEVEGKGKDKAKSTAPRKKVGFQLPADDSTPDEENFPSGIERDSAQATAHDLEIATRQKVAIHVASHLKWLALFSIRYIDSDSKNEGSENEALGDNKDNTDENQGTDIFALSKGPLTFQDTPVDERFNDPPTTNQGEEQDKHSTPSLSPVSLPFKPIGSTTDHDFIYNEIQQQRLKNPDRKTFVPAHVIRGLATREMIGVQLTSKVDSSMLDQLIDYILEKPAIKVFLILAYIGCTRKIVDCYQNGFYDNHLPVKKHSTSNGAYCLLSMNQELSFQREGSPLLFLTPTDLHGFDYGQWFFMAPVFTKNKFNYELYQKCPLPIVREFPGRKGGLSGSVIEVEVHEAHQKVLDKIDGKRVRVALKKINPQMGDYYQKEKRILAVIREINHPHLLMPIASYEYRGEDGGYFLFPWAEGGNLRDFWATESTQPLKEPKMMSWIIEQLHGLIEALSILHSNAHRHGDLKPENILLFHEGPYKGILRIANVDLGPSHEVAALEREKVPVPSTIVSTRYTPPESIFVAQIPRKSDVWSMGCVFVEFLIWILSGHESLQDFAKARFDGFWEPGPIVHSNVQPWLDHLTKSLKGSESALSDLLSLVKSNMLVLDYNLRDSSDEVRKRLNEIRLKAASDSGYLLDNDLSSRIHSPQFFRSAQVRLSPAEPLTRRRASLANPPPYTPDDVQHGDIPIRVHEVEDAPMQSVQNIPATMKRFMKRFEKPLRRRLNDIGHSQPDNDFARRLHARDDWPSAALPREPSKLCQKCASFDILRLTFETNDLVSNLDTRSLDCELCNLFYQSAIELGMSDHETFACKRVSSNLCIQPSGRSIMTIYSNLESLNSNIGAQLGSPLLPEPGSSAQFALMDEWLRACQDTHHHRLSSAQSSQAGSYRHSDLASSEFPTRVIDVGSPEDPKLQLINGEHVESQDYIALSHCWGQSSFFLTQKHNVQDLYNSINFDVLPSSFKDAITVARGLRVRYLWIDSLCIIQGPNGDWEQGAARMQQVFSNATCVIAASSATSSAEGFLVPEPPRQQREFVTMRSSSGSLLYVAKSIDNFHRDVEEAVLNKRGWVLQERALARRLIHFTTTQLYMECGKGIHCESLTKLTNEKISFLGDSDFPRSILPYYRGGRIVLFQDLFKIYSGLSFSQLTDRSVAIFGLEQKLMTTFKTKGGYGIFEMYLERSLLWTRPEDSSLTLINYPPQRNVPSWSWMRYEGRISYLNPPVERIIWTKDYESPFYNPNETEEKNLYWAIKATSSNPVLKSNKARKLLLGSSNTDIMQSIRFDLKDEPKEPLDKLRCVILGKEERDVPGRDGLNYILVTAPSSPEMNGAHRRVGVGTLLDTYIDWSTEECIEVY